MPAVQSVRCACGCVVGKYYLNKHMITKKHQKLMVRFSPPITTIRDVLKAMDDLEEKMDTMDSYEYLTECNRLKGIYDGLRRSDYMINNNFIRI